MSISLARYDYSARGVGLGNISRDVLIIAFVLAISVFVPVLKPAIYISLVGMVLFGPLAIVKALTLSWLAAFSTPLFGDSSGVSALRIMLIFLSFGAIVFRQIYLNNKAPPNAFYTVWLFGFVVAVMALMVSFAVDVSLLKTLIFTVGISTVLWCVHCVHDTNKLKEWFTALFVVVLVASIPFLFSGAGYLRNGVNFQGILAHPQIMGSFAGVASAWLFIRVFVVGKQHMFMTLALLLALAMMFFSGARTGFVAVLVGISVSTLMAPKLAQSTRGVFVIYTLCIFGLIGAVILPATTSFFQDFLLKDHLSGSVVEAFQQSRGDLIYQSWQNFLDNPFLGIGFGLPSHETLLNVKYDPVFGLPLGASVEKGFFFTGLLEEIGLVGAVFFFVMMYHLMKRTLATRDPARFALFFTPIATNIGDATLFSFGGNGLLIWLLVAYASMARRS